MEFKKLEIEAEDKGIQKLLKSKHIRRSLIYILIGALAGFGYFYFSEAQQMETWFLRDSLNSIFFGGFLGFFITNSPCSRNRC